MAEIALGWLGWTEEQALSADVNAIVVGYEARRLMFVEMGLIESRPAGAGRAAAAQGRVLTPQMFDAVFG